jgi:thymidylate kinase
MIMHIAIEGLDGVGKTSTAKILADKLGFRFIEKPMSFFTDNDNELTRYMYLTEWLNTEAPNTLKACFYGCGNILIGIKSRNENIITDRHLASNFYWNGDKTNEAFFASLIETAGIPDLTVILYATPDIRRERIISRNPDDKDIGRLGQMPPNAYDKMKSFVKKYSMPYVFIDNSSMSIEQTVDKIVEYIKNKI